MEELDEPRPSRLLENIARIREQALTYRGGDRCLVAPSPGLSDKIKKEFERLRGDASPAVRRLLKTRDKNRVGFNDGLIFPGSFFPVGTPAHVVRSVAGSRAPLHGVLRVAVVLVDFSDEGFAAAHSQQYYEDLFFSEGVLANGSVREYFLDVTGGKVELTGQVVGPYRMPKKLKDYANGASGTGNVQPNARTMAKDAAVAANPDVDFGLYDNDHDGFVDAFVIVQAGPGAEATGSDDHIWSHKWVLPSVYTADGAKIYAYLVVPEEARIGVCAHELGHLLFGFPDLYDTDYSSEGIGNWCLMAGGSWNGNGDVPAHPSAWCKVNQDWVSVVQPTSNGVESIPDVKDSKTVYRLWKDGAPGDEYFLVENRQRTGYDAQLPGDGLLVWHVDDAIGSNANETHPRVALEQADGKQDLENGSNRGDAGDPFPGSAGVTSFNASTTPGSKSYGGMDTCVAVENVGASGPVMSALLKVKCTPTKQLPEKDWRKEFLKDRSKDFLKDFTKERLKELIKDKEKELKEKELKEKDKEKEFKESKDFKEKDKDLFEGPGSGGLAGFVPGAFPGIGAATGFPEAAAGQPPADPGSAGPPARPGTDAEARLAALEQQMAAVLPFIHKALRPELGRSALSREEDLQRTRRAAEERSSEAKQTRSRKKKS